LAGGVFKNKAMQTIQQQIAQRIKQLRKDQRISQEVFAEKAGIDKKYLSDIECGKRNVSVTIVEVVALTFGLSLQEFFNNKIFKA